MNGSSETWRVLVVEDTEDDYALLLRELHRSGRAIDALRVETADAMRRALRENQWDLVLSDYSLPQFNAPAALVVLHEEGLDLPFIIVSGTIGEDVAVAALKAGGHDFMPKNNLERLLPAVERELREAASRRQRRLVEERLHQSREEMTAVFTASPLPIVVVNAQGNVMRWNPAAERVFGWTAEEVIGRPPPFTAASEQGALQEGLRRVLEGEQFNAEEATQYRKDGHALRIRVSAAPLRDAAGVVIGGMVIMTDVTEQRRLEEQFRQAQKLEAVGQLAGGVAHDFNNVLTAITGYADLVLNDLAEDDPHRADLNEIVNAVQRAAAFTRQLLAFSRKQIIQPESLDLNEVTTAVHRMLLRMVSEDVELILQLEPGLGRILADRSQIEQVLMNLVVNARDAIQPGGKITIRTHTRPEVGALQPAEDLPSAGCVVLEVEDTGTGIPPEIMERIFEPFFTTKESGKGTGLGLSTVYGIVQQNGGTMRVTSEVGSGTTFHIYFPVADLETEAAVTPARGSAERTAEGAHILIVDDDLAIRGVLVRTLERARYRVHAVDSPSEALRVLANGQRIDLLLTDVMLPEMNGGELVEHARRRRPDLKVMYMSGYTPEEAGVHRGAVFIEKPFTTEDLLRKVLQALSSQES